jgi:hypothetical protein
MCEKDIPILIKNGLSPEVAAGSGVHPNDWMDMRRWRLETGTGIHDSRGRMQGIEKLWVRIQES